MRKLRAFLNVLYPHLVMGRDPQQLSTVAEPALLGSAASAKLRAELLGTQHSSALVSNGLRRKRQAVTHLHPLALQHA